MTAAGDQARLTEIVADVLEVDPSAVTDEDGPTTLPEWTSLRHLQLIVTLEEVYQLSFSYQEVRNVESIGRLRAILQVKGALV